MVCHNRELLAKMSVTSVMIQNRSLYVSKDGISRLQLLTPNKKSIRDIYIYIYIICQSRDGNLVELPTLPVEIAIVISTGRDANHDLYQYKLVELQTLPVEIAIVISTRRECNCDSY